MNTSEEAPVHAHTHTQNHNNKGGSHLEQTEEQGAN